MLVSWLQWAEAQKQCKRLKLQDLVISPMQRLTKYKLLLKAILKKTEKESHRKDLIQMVSLVLCWCDVMRCYLRCADARVT